MEEETMLETLSRLKGIMDSSSAKTLSTWEETLKNENAREELMSNLAFVNLIKRFEEEIDSINAKLTSDRRLTTNERLLMFERRGWIESILLSLKVNPNVKKGIKKELDYLTEQEK